MLSAIVGTITVLTAVIGEPPPRTKGRTPVLDAIAARQWDAPGARDHLDVLSLDELTALIGDPIHRPIFVETPGLRWKVGDARPALADEDPAVMAALSHCLLSRRRAVLGTVDVVPASALHPVRCGWCQYPLEELQAAVEWGVWYRAEVIVDVLVWLGATGQRNYVRFQSGGITRPQWRTFAGLPATEQRYQVEQVLKAARPPAVPA